MAPRVLLIHGYLSCPEAWAPLQRELAGEIETFAPNQAGYGPAADPSDYTPDGLAEAFDATLGCVSSLTTCSATRWERWWPCRWRSVIPGASGAWGWLACPSSTRSTTGCASRG